MNDKTINTDSTETKRPWSTPRVETSETFNKAALACCLNGFNQAIGSSGTGLPAC
ncbi:MAG: hypothetical protein ACJAYU_003032 [Bradymonadia bacterium]|jgi:hypothetical protein